MSWQPGTGIEVAISLGVGQQEQADLAVNRTNRVAYLTLGTVAEIRLESGHLETLRDQLPSVLVDLDVLDAAWTRAADAGSRATELAAYLTDQALTAEQAGDLDRAATLRANADKLTAASAALDGALQAVNSTARLVDNAADDARRLLDDHPATGQPPDAT
jgi:hypothetical protein